MYEILDLLELQIKENGHVIVSTPLFHIGLFAPKVFAFCFPFFFKAIFYTVLAAKGKKEYLRTV